MVSSPGLGSDATFGSDRERDVTWKVFYKGAADYHAAT